MTTVLIPATIIVLALAALMALAAGAVTRAVGWLAERRERRVRERSPIDSDSSAREWLEFERAYRSYAEPAAVTAACVRCGCSRA